MLHHLTQDSQTYRVFREKLDGKRVRTVSEVEARGAEVRAAYGRRDLLRLGILDVTASPYGADATGTKDATEALQRALDDGRDARLQVYLPPGTYRVSAPLRGIQGIVLWDQWPFESGADPCELERSIEYPCSLEGPSPGGGTGRGRAVIQLVDNCPGFQDPEKTQPLVHFWARWSALEPDRPRGNIGFALRLRHVDVDLGRGNPGAVGIRITGAEYAAVEDVNIRAYGAFAGQQHPPGSGGVTRGLRVWGGRYGVHAESSQPSPMLLDCRFEDQEVAGVYHNSRGPMTLIGCEFIGAGVAGGTGNDLAWNGNLVLLDCLFRLDRDRAAVASPRAVYVENCWVKGAETLLRLPAGDVPAPEPESWTCIEEFVNSAVSNKNPGGERVEVHDRIERQGQVDKGPLLWLRPGEAPPADLITRHRLPELPHWEDPGVLTVTLPEGAEKQASQLLQEAVDRSRFVFLGKGEYVLTEPLRLRPDTVLFGSHGLHATLTSAFSPAFCNPVLPQPLVDTPDDAKAAPYLADVRLCPRSDVMGSYALRWRSGRGSVVRGIIPQRSFWHPDTPTAIHPNILIEGNGGGRWLGMSLQGYWAQGIHYRHLLARGLKEPLTFYHYQPQHVHGLYQTEFIDCADVAMLSIKSEGNAPIARFLNCGRVRLYGFSGNFCPFPRGSIFVLDKCPWVRVVQNTKQRMIGKLADGEAWKGHFIYFDLAVPDTEQFYLKVDGDLILPVAQPLALWTRGHTRLTDGDSASPAAVVPPLPLIPSGSGS